MTPMMERQIEMCKVTVDGGSLAQREIDAYIDHARKKYGREPVAMKIRVDGDFVDIDYDFCSV
jgi:hypothetical protein